jgi:hypothetical protein
VPSSNPDVPFSNPDVPSYNPDVPSSNPDVPFSNPDVPSYNPDVPSSNPDVPFSNPDVPSSKSSLKLTQSCFFELVKESRFNWFDLVDRVVKDDTEPDFLDNFFSYGHGFG